jgi:hypothetical protein
VHTERLKPPWFVGVRIHVFGSKAIETRSSVRTTGSFVNRACVKKTVAHEAGPSAFSQFVGAQSSALTLGSAAENANAWKVWLQPNHIIEIASEHRVAAHGSARENNHVDGDTALMLASNRAHRFAGKTQGGLIEVVDFEARADVFTQIGPAAPPLDEHRRRHVHLKPIASGQLKKMCCTLLSALQGDKHSGIEHQTAHYAARFLPGATSRLKAKSSSSVIAAWPEPASTLSIAANRCASLSKMPKNCDTFPRQCFLASLAANRAA